MVYDVTHNIAKIERYQVNGEEKELLIHRKGATRSFPPGHPELAERYRATGQPVIIGGSMETGSYLLIGTAKAMEESFGSTCHGSGRTMSRTAAKKKVHGRDLLQRMEQKGIYVRAASFSGVAEEAGMAYKNISDVVEAVDSLGLSKKVVRLQPIGNIKG
jgi:tRNA-splicing ligase RtcB